MKKISVIIPCYNSVAFLDDCFDSVVKQTIGIDSLEVIFVNDASTDNTLDKLMGYESRYPESVMVINLEENVKQGGARNIGLSYASGEYVVFLDSDDFIDHDFYEELYDIAKKYDTDIIQYPFLHVKVDENKNVIKEAVSHFSKIKEFFEVNTVEERTNFLAQEILNYSSQSKFYRREFLIENDAAFTVGRYYEEPSFVYPLLLTGKRFYGYNKAKYYYRENMNSTVHKVLFQDGKLYDHPFVQLDLYNKVKQNEILYGEYKDVIDYYFVETFFVETIMFAVAGNLYLGYDMFSLIKDTVRGYVPNWKTNRFILMSSDDDKNVLKLLDIEIGESVWIELLNRWRNNG